MKNKLIYVTTVDLNDGSAQSSQILSMSRAFADILGPYFSVYGFTNSDEILSNNPAIDLNLYKVFHSKLLRVIYVFYVALISGSRNSNVFTRDLYLAFLFLITGSKVVWESHQGTSTFAKITLKFLSLFSRFKVLAISKALMESKEIPVRYNQKYFYHDGVCPALINDKIDFTDSLLNKKVAIYTGALHKGDDINSISPLFSKYSDWSFYIIGGRSIEVSAFREKYKKLSNVFFLGRLPHNEVCSFQRNASVLIYPLTKSNKLWLYTSPLKLFEYMAAGRPILASNIGSVCEIVDERNAFIFNENINIVDSFNDFCNSSISLIEEKIQININLVKTRYNWVARAKFIVELY